MRLTVRTLKARARAEHGFTMIIAMGAMTVTALLIAAVLLAVQSDATITGRDLNEKRAYYAAQAALNAYLYHLNQDSSYWQTCADDVQALTSVPGSTTGEQYAYQPIYNSGYSSTNCSANPISALIDNTTGTIRMEFYGYAGNPQVSRGIVASFRKDSPLDFLWYTVYEALDSSISGFSGCNVFYRNGRNANCNISWVNGDSMNGPMYTEDQYLIGGTASFGRSSADEIESAAPGSSPADICSGDNCGSLSMVGTAVPNAGVIAPPSDNSSLLTDATHYGVVYNGTTTITLSGAGATVVNCPGTSASSACTTSTISLASDPIIYVSNASGCTPAAYTPFGATYPTNGSGNYYGRAGDVYIQGNYTSALTVAAAHAITLHRALTPTPMRRPVHRSSAAPQRGPLARIALKGQLLYHSQSANEEVGHERLTAHGQLAAREARGGRRRSRRHAGRTPPPLGSCRCPSPR